MKMYENGCANCPPADFAQVWRHGLVVGLPSKASQTIPRARWLERLHQPKTLNNDKPHQFCIVVCPRQTMRKHDPLKPCKVSLDPEYPEGCSGSPCKWADESSTDFRVEKLAIHPTPQDSKSFQQANSSEAPCSLRTAWKFSLPSERSSELANAVDRAGCLEAKKERQAEKISEAEKQKNSSCQQLQQCFTFSISWLKKCT